MNGATTVKAGQRWSKCGQLHKRRIRSNKVMGDEKIKIRRIIALALSFAFMMSLMPVCALDVDKSESEGIALTEVGNIRTAIATDEANEYRASYDYETQTFSFVIHNLTTGEVSSRIVNLCDKEAELATAPIGGDSLLRGWSAAYRDASTLDNRATNSFHQCDTESGYFVSVTFDTQTLWRLERPQDDDPDVRYYFLCYENSSNSSELDAFYDAVVELRDRELNLQALTSQQQLKTISTALLVVLSLAGFSAPGAAIDAALAVFNLTDQAHTAGELLAHQISVCYFRIEDVYYNTDNMHA